MRFIHGGTAQKLTEEFLKKLTLTYTIDHLQNSNRGVLKSPTDDELNVVTFGQSNP